MLFFTCVNVDTDIHNSSHEVDLVAISQVIVLSKHQGNFESLSLNLLAFFILVPLLRQQSNNVEWPQIQHYDTIHTASYIVISGNISITLINTLQSPWQSVQSRYSETPKPKPQKSGPKNPQTSRLSEFREKLHTITCDIYYWTSKIPDFLAD